MTASCAGPERISWSCGVLYLREGMPVQGNLNLNICEAHAFNTTDKFTLDVFVVNGWSGEVRCE